MKPSIIFLAAFLVAFIVAGSVSSTSSPPPQPTNTTKPSSSACTRSVEVIEMTFNNATLALSNSLQYCNSPQDQSKRCIAGLQVMVRLLGSVVTETKKSEEVCGGNTTSLCVSLLKTFSLNVTSYAQEVSNDAIPACRTATGWNSLCGPEVKQVSDDIVPVVEQLNKLTDVCL